MNPRLSPRMTASLFCGIDRPRIDTDRTTAANRQDIMLKNKKDKTYLLINMTCTLDTNTSVKTTEKLTKYKDLEIEVERIWGSKQQSQWLWLILIIIITIIIIIIINHSSINHEKKKKKKKKKKNNNNNNNNNNYNKKY